VLGTAPVVTGKAAAAPVRLAVARTAPARAAAAPDPSRTPPAPACAEVGAADQAAVTALPVMSAQHAAEVSGPLAVALSGLPPVEEQAFRSRAAVSSAKSGNPHSPGTPGTPGPLAPGGTRLVAGLDAGGSGSGGAGSSGSSGNGGIPHAVLADPDSAPPVFALSVLTAPERRATWWYPEVVVGPG
jgi:hypothetical protein